MDSETLATRRRRVLERLGGGVLVLPSMPAAARNGDVEHAYRQSSDLLYLTGFREPDSVLVLNPASPKPFTMFVRPRDRDAEIWNGRRAGVEGVQSDFGADQAFTIDELDKELPALLQGAHTLFWPLGQNPAMDERIVRLFAAMQARQRTGTPVPERISSVGPLLHEMRLFKEPAELERLREASRLTRLGFERAMAATRSGMREYEIEAELLYEFRKGGGDGPGYEPIVAAGVNATVLHYRTGRDTLRDSELVLVDCGCELDGYTADVTRTWPANGRFTPAQQALYDIVLEAQHRAIAAVRPGTTREAVHDTAVRALVEGLIHEKLLAGSVDEVIADKSFRRYYMHGTSHWLGLDVHDAGAYFAAGTGRPLAGGMVLTVEPGLYVAQDDEKAPAEMRGVGIRIEDDVAVTAEGCEVLTAGIPATREELRRIQGV